MVSKTNPDISTDENPEWTAKDFAMARKGSDVFAELDLPVPSVRGRPKSDYPKQQVTLRLDAEIVAHFKAGGKGWQTRINDALKERVKREA